MTGYYAQRSGHFTQEDPIGLAGGLNLYGYANGDPVNLSDPFGLCPPDDDNQDDCPTEEDEEVESEDEGDSFLDDLRESDFGQCVAEGRRLFDAGVSELFTGSLVLVLGGANVYSRGRIGGVLRLPRPFRMPGMNTTLSGAVNSGRLMSTTTIGRYTIGGAFSGAGAVGLGFSAGKWVFVPAMCGVSPSFYGG